uniref:Uncharacterized protein n=1 Tax=Arundo donax TaxID=35708 RepID=A0A0A9HCS7_ARUDO
MANLSALPIYIYHSILQYQINQPISNSIRMNLL